MHHNSSSQIVLLECKHSETSTPVSPVTVIASVSKCIGTLATVLRPREVRHVLRNSRYPIRCTAHVHSMSRALASQPSSSPATRLRTFSSIPVQSLHTGLDRSCTREQFLGREDHPGWDL